MLIASPFSGDAGLDPKDIPGTKTDLVVYLKGKNSAIKPKKEIGYRQLSAKRWFKNKDVFELHLSGDSTFEPYYMTNRFIQLYDETFITWGHDKVTQIKDMRSLGYKLKVMPDAYMVHLNHKDIKGYTDWSTGLNKEPRYRLKVGTSSGRREAIPGFFTNTYYPEWLKNTNTSDKESSGTTNEVLKEILSTKSYIAQYKSLLYGLMTIYTFILIALINAIRQRRS